MFEGIPVINIRHTNIKYLTVTSLIGSAIHLLGPFYPVYLYMAGINVALLGFLKSLSEVAKGVTDLPTGVFADRYGRAKIGAIGLLLNGVGILQIILFPNLQTYLLLVVGFLCIGLGDAFISGSFEAWVTEEYKRSGRFESLKSLFSKVRILLPLIGIICGIMGSSLSSIYFGLPLILSVLSLFVALGITLFTFEENYGSKSSCLKLLKKGLNYMLKHKSYQFFTLGYSIISTMFLFFIFTWSILLIDLELSKEMLGLVYIFLLSAMSIGGIGSGILLKRYDYRTIACAMSISLLISFLLVGLAPSLLFAIISLMIFEFAWGALTPSLIYWRNCIIPSAYRATLISLTITVSALVSPSIVTGLSALSTKIGLGQTYLIAPLFGALSPIFLWVARQHSTAATL